MIPPEPRGKPNRSERALFSAFEGILDRPDWVVIHSLAIGQHRAGLSGEIDFLVLVPGKGIVIIEAKSPAYVEYKAGRWHLDRTPSPSKDPLQQLDGARRSLRRLLKNAGLLQGNEPIARLVWFTSLGRYQFVNRTPGDLQFFEWELGWQEDLEKPAWLIEKVLDEHLAWFNEVDEVAIDPASMTAEHVAEISTTLLADFTASRSKADDRRDRADREKRLLAEQKFALELLTTNPHIYFEGPAGTGKSFLLVEAAVRFARDLRMPTLLTCWNVLMAEELRNLVRGRTQLIDVDDLNTVMLRICGLAANPTDADDTWYRETLPQRALKAVTEQPHLAKYQALCIDEFQDVACEPHVLNLVLALTAAPVAYTPVVLAGDDRQQILAGSGERESSVSVARTHLPALVHARVRRNCRMLPSIADSVSKYLDPAFTFTGHRMPSTLPGGFTRVEVEGPPRSRHWPLRSGSSWSTMRQTTLLWSVLSAATDHSRPGCCAVRERPPTRPGCANNSRTRAVPGGCAGTQFPSSRASTRMPSSSPTSTTPQRRGSSPRVTRGMTSVMWPGAGRSTVSFCWTD